MLFFRMRKATEIIIFYLFSIILAKRFGLRTPACAENTYFRLCGGSASSATDARVSLRGLNHIMCMNNKNSSPLEFSDV